MKFAMLARNPNLYSHKRLVEAAELRGHQIDIINTLRVFMNITSHRPELRYGDEKLTGYDAVIPRIGASVTFYGLAVLAIGATAWSGYQPPCGSPSRPCRVTAA